MTIPDGISWRPRYESPVPDPLPPTKGPLVGKWIETYLRQGEGDYYGEPFRLAPFQKYALSRIFELDSRGNWLHDRILIGVPKGNGKSALAAAIGLAGLAGPTAPKSPNIPVAAASFDQADLVFGAARTMAEESPLLRPHVELYDTEIRLKGKPGVLKRIAAVGNTNDGTLPTQALIDEFHVWEGAARERLWVVLGNGIKKRANGQIIAITTAGGDRESLLGRYYDYGLKVASGEVIDPGFLFLWWEPHREWDLDNEEQLLQAIYEANPAAHPGGWLIAENLVSRATDPNLARYEFERYHLNRWAEAPEAFVKADAWRACGRNVPPPPEGSEIVMAFDGSYTRDTTALIGCTLDGHLFVIGHWEPSPGEPVPRDEVDARVAWAMKNWRVIEFAADPPGWHTELEAWQSEYGPEVVIPFDSNVGSVMAPATDRFRADVEQGAITHDGNPALARHVANCRTKETRWGLVVRKEHKDSPKRIDLAVAAIIARHRALDRAPEAAPTFIPLD